MMGEVKEKEGGGQGDVVHDKYVAELRVATHKILKPWGNWGPICPV